MLAIYIARILCGMFLMWAFPTDARPWEIGFGIMFLLPLGLPILIGLAYGAGTVPAVISPNKRLAIPIFGTLLAIDTLLALEQIWVEGRHAPVALTFALLLTSVPAFIALATLFTEPAKEPSR